MIDSRQKIQDKDSNKGKILNLQMIESTNLLYIIRGRSGAPPASGPIGMEEFSSGRVESLVLVRAEIVPLRLQQVSRQSFAPEAIEVAQCRGERGYRDSMRKGRGTYSAPALLCRQLLLEERVEQQVLECRVVIKRILNSSEARPMMHLRHTRRCPVV